MVACYAFFKPVTQPATCTSVSRWFRKNGNFCAGHIASRWEFQVRVSSKVLMLFGEYEAGVG